MDSQTYFMRFADALLEELLEVMGAAEEEKAAENLLKLSNRIDTDKVGKPSFLMILTAGQFAYRRKDGVYVVPLACLKP